MKKKTIYKILVIIIILFTISCEQEKPKATPKEKTEDKTPEERTEDKTPTERTEDKTPTERTEDKTPEERTEDKTPEERTEDKTPEERTEDKTPEERTEDKTPAETTEETPKTAGDYIQEAKDEKAKGNDREAEEALNEAIRLSDSDEARRLRSEIYFVNKQYDEAYEDASKAIEIDPNNYLNYVSRLKVTMGLNNHLARQRAAFEKGSKEYIEASAEMKRINKEQEADAIASYNLLNKPKT